MKIANIATSFVLIITSLLFIYVIIPEQTKPVGEAYGMAPSLLPKVMMITIGVLSVVLLIKSLLIKAQKTEVFVINKRSFLNLLLFSIILFLSIGIMNFFGFIPGSVLMLAALSLILKLRSPLSIALVSLLPPILFYYVLTYGLDLALP